VSKVAVAIGRSLSRLLSNEHPAGITLTVQGTRPNIKIKAAIETVLHLWQMALSFPAFDEADDESYDAMTKLFMATEEIGSAS
jgi:hypothetical protein